MSASQVTGRSFLQGASGPHLLSIPALLGTYAVSTLATVWSAVGVINGQPLPWFLISTASHIPLFLAAWILRRTVLPVTPRQSRPVLAVVALSFMGLLRGVLLAVLAHVTALEPFTGSLYRPIGSAVLIVIVGSLISWALDESARYRLTISELETTAQSLEQSRGSLEMIIRAERQRILDVIATNVLAPITALRETLATSTLDRKSTASAVSRITELIDTSVKPLSRRLHDEVMTWSPQPSVRNRIAARTDITKIKSSVPLGPIAQGLVLFVVTPSVLSTQFPVQTAAALALSAALLLTGVLWLCKAIIDAVSPAMTFGKLVIATLGSQAIAGLVLWAYASTVAGGRLPDVLAVGGAFTSASSGIVIAVAILSRRAGQVREADLRSLNAELASSVSRISSQVWMHQNRIAEVLHGDVQSSLIVAAARLANTESLGALSHQDVEQILKPVEEAVHGLESSEYAEESIEGFQQELQSVWSGVVDIQMSVSPGAADALSGDPELLTLAAALIREAVGNAYRHGQAKAVDVALDLESQGLAVSVSNEGKAPAGDRIGLGTQLLNAGTLSWRRSHESGITRLSAFLALSTRA